MKRDFSTISPSAKSIIEMKAHTSIPFALEAAKLVALPSDFSPDYENNDRAFWGRVLHFEARDLSINQLLDDLDIGNILELSSGYSFRGLERSSKKGIFYIDTDLPELIAQKKEMLKNLDHDKGSGVLELLPLNALDEMQFRETVKIFPPGEIAIMNEGLLIYFSMKEKEALCGIIHRILEERGGCWITSDIYIRATTNGSKIGNDEKLDKFSKEHNIEDNKFVSIEQAKEFFENNGFTIEREESLDMSGISSFKYFMRSLGGDIPLKSGGAGKMQTTWRLRIAEARRE